MRTEFRIITFFMSLALAIVPATAADNPSLFGQAFPGAEPQSFAGNLLSTEKHPHGQLSFSSDGKTAFWSAMLADGPVQTVFFSIFDGKTISKPAVAPFAADSGNGGPVFSADGRRIYFSAYLPYTGSATATTTAICYVDRTDSGWSKPVVIEATVDTLMTKGQVSVARSGNLYFTGRVLKGGSPTIYVCEKSDGRYQTPRALSGPIASLPLCVDPWVDPDETFMLVSCPPPAGAPMRTDIGVSRRQTDEAWSLPVSIGVAVNTDAFERFASLTPDGKYLFFIRSTAERFVGPGAHYYWVDAKILDGLK